MTPKTDLFTAIHKAIRTMLYEGGKRLQATDFADKNETQAILEHLNHVMAFLHEHAENEDKLIFPAVERVAPGVTSLAEAQHREYESLQDQLVDQMDAISDCADPAERIKMGTKLNRIYGSFLAFSLLHLNTEEETVLPASQELLSDEELMEIRTRITSSIPPDVYERWMEYMLPSMTVSELKGMFVSMRGKVPAPIFENMKSFANAVVPARRWQKVMDSLSVMQP